MGCPLDLVILIQQQQRLRALVSMLGTLDSNTSSANDRWGILIHLMISMNLYFLVYKCG